ncbi:MAG: transcriptional repressor [Porticoccaceae bacterium]|jgi:Fur family zinc uptake transcriptional regulator
MAKTHISRAIDKAEDRCGQAGVKLTAKRKNVLATLLSSAVPLSAYEVAELYRQSFDEVIPPMSVYRMLDFLQEENLAHKLSSTNKYIACSHIACDHQHETPQFLICDRCHRVSEIAIRNETIQALRDSVQAAGFFLSSPQLELHGLCGSCKMEDPGARPRAGQRPA